MFDIIGKKWVYFLLSALLIIPGSVSLALWGLRLGIDFTGGTLLEIGLEKAAAGSNLPQSKENEEKKQISDFLKDTVEISTISRSGEKTYLLRTKQIENPKDKFEEIKKKLETAFGNVEQKRLETARKRDCPRTR